MSPEAITGSGGDLIIQAGKLSIREGGTISVSTFGSGDAGNITIQNTQSVEIIGQTPNNTPSSLQARVNENVNGRAGSIIVDAGQLSLSDGAEITSRSEGTGSAGNITLNIVPGTIRIRDSTIQASATQASGGAITINADNIQLFGDGDIRTEVTNGIGGGGNITIAANFLIALDDSDILAFARDGSGGNIDLSQTTFFGENFRFAPPGTDPSTLDGNDRADINASGAIASGNISIGDSSFIEASLTDLPESILNPDTLIANSCVARATPEPEGRFIITGTGGLPLQPGDPLPSTYTTAPIQAIPAKTDTPARTNDGSSLRAANPQPDITEPTGVYRLTNGRLVLSRECSEPPPQAQ